MGSFSASPVPQPVIDALTDVQVTSTVGSQAGFQLKFTLGKTSPLQQLLQSGFFDPRTRVIIAVTVNGATEVLMDGIITKHDVTASNEAGKSLLTVTGLDLTALMDFIDLTGIPYPALPMFLIVDIILAKYAVLGVVPVAIPPILALIQNPIERFLKQEGTDYAYMTKLAAEVGAVFYLDPGPLPGMSVAYWGPDLSKMFGGPQPALSINFDADVQLGLVHRLVRRHAGHPVLRHDHRAELEDPDSDPDAEPRHPEGAAGGAGADAVQERAAEAHRQQGPGRAPPSRASARSSKSADVDHRERAARRAALRPRASRRGSWSRSAAPAGPTTATTT